MAEKKAYQVEDWLNNPDRNIALVLIYGPDRGLVSERAAVFAKSTGLPVDDVFAVTRIDAITLDGDPGRLIDEARTVSMFGGQRLIWVRGGAAQASLATAVSDLLADPPPDTCILIEAGELRKGAKLRSLVEKSQTGIALPCYADDARAIDRLIDSQLSAAGVAIDMEARDLLKRSLGGDRLASRSELDKLLLFVDGQEEISVADVAASVGDAAGLSQDGIVDAVLSGDPRMLENRFSRAMRSGLPPFLTAAAAMREFHALQKIRAMVELSGKTPAAAVTSARPPVFFARKPLFEKAAAALDLAFIARALDRLQQTVLRSRQYPELGAELVRQALLALSLEINAAARRR